MVKRLRINDEIRVSEVMLIDEETKAVVSIQKAMEMAALKGLDLVEVSPLTQPPVCKILDFGAYVYQQKKKEKAQKKGQKQAETKTIRLGVRTELHDLEVKANQSRRFLADRSIIKVVLIFHGREVTHEDLGFEKMKQFYKMLEDIATIEQEPKRQGYQMTMILNPKK